ncbi:MAG: cytochrome c peroxidase [Chthoniobacteraceae bacterium]
MNRGGLAVIAAGLAAVFSTGCEREPAERVLPFTAEEVREVLKLSPLPPTPANPTNAVADNPAAARLGQRLFFDKRLSANGEISCATCHDPAHGFSDGKPLSEGLKPTERHSMALWNVGHQRWFFWNGRADSLWAQALQPLLHEKEMGVDPEHLRAVLADDASMKADYEAIFGPLPPAANAGDRAADTLLANFGKALEAYQRLIVSTGAPFDRFVATMRSGGVAREPRAISESAQRGLQLFVGRGGCVLCHAGPNFTDGEFHNIGMAGVPPDQGRFEGIQEVRADRFNGLGEFSDDRSPAANIKLRYLTVKLNHLGEFKTPTLRNVAGTAPYMHDGRFATLREVIDFYSELPGEPAFGHREDTLVPLKFTEQEKADLEAFLRTLTGAPLDASLTQPPVASQSMKRRN